MSKRIFGRTQLIQKFHDFGIIKRKGPDYPDGFKLKSGEVSDIYVNIRDLIRFPALFNYTIFCMTELVSINYPNSLKSPCVLGIPTMGAVIAPVVAYKRGLRLSVIRQNTRDHGIGKSIEGGLTQNIILIDDVVTSCKSINETIENYIEPEIGSDYDLKIFVIADRRKERDLKIHSLMTMEEIRAFDPLEENNDRAS